MSHPPPPALDPDRRGPAMDLLRLATAGNVDDGKSTLLGRLLYDTKSIFEDQWEAVERASRRRGDGATDLALLTDGLRAEREQGITIDVAHRYFSTPRRKFILADCPGHFQYTRNMVTGASGASAALLLLDVRHGLTEQTCRHAFISTLLRIRHLIVCVNKMDLVDFAEAAFLRVREEFMTYAARLHTADIQFVPISALHGDNVATKSARTPWYEGASLLFTLENLYVRNDANLSDPRFPVQLVLRANGAGPQDFRGYAGQVASGIFRPGEEVVHLPTGFAARIASIRGPDGPVPEAFFPMSVVIELDRDLDIGRGDLLAKPNNAPAAAQEFDVILCWFGEAPLDPARRYGLRHTTRETKCLVRGVRYTLDVRTLHRREDRREVGLNDLARVRLRTMNPIFVDSYERNRQTGCLLLVDEVTHATVAAGMIL